MGELEERDVGVARVDVPLCRRDEAVGERRPQHRLLGGQRLGQPDRAGDRVVGQQAPRVRLREAEPDERVLDAPADPLRVGEPAVELAS